MPAGDKAVFIIRKSVRFLGLGEMRCQRGDVIVLQVGSAVFYKVSRDFGGKKMTKVC